MAEQKEQISLTEEDLKLEAELILKFDCGNCRLQKDEVIILVNEFKEILAQHHLKLIDYECYR